MDDQFIYLSYSEENYPYIYVKEGRFEGFLVEVSSFIRLHFQCLFRFGGLLLACWRKMYQSPSITTVRSINNYRIDVYCEIAASLAREKEEIYDGSLGGILNGSIFSAADGGFLLSPFPNRLNSFTPSAPVLYTGVDQRPNIIYCTSLLLPGIIRWAIQTRFSWGNSNYFLHCFLSGNDRRSHNLSSRLSFHWSGNEQIQR